MRNSTYLNYIEQETLKVVKDTAPEKLPALLIKFVQEKCLQSYISGYITARERYQK